MLLKYERSTVQFNDSVYQDPKAGYLVSVFVRLVYDEPA